MLGAVEVSLWNFRYHHILYIHLFNTLVDSSYQEGSIRLVGGDYNWEGRVEIFYSGTWSTISDNSWTNSDTAVVCRQLRHSIEGEFVGFFLLNVAA